MPSLQFVSSQHSQFQIHVSPTGPFIFSSRKAYNIAHKHTHNIRQKLCSFIEV